MLVARQVNKRFGGVTAIENCSFTIAAHSITGLIGPNGAGKTTMFNLIAGALRPDSGKLIFNNSDITGTPTHQLFRQGIVRTFQTPHEFSRQTVLENLLVVPENQIGEQLMNNWFLRDRIHSQERMNRQRAEEVLDFLGLASLRDKLAGNLSGGQKKLLDIGRTMMIEPKLVLLDEPGAGVNPTLLEHIAQTIRRLNQERGYTFCIIEHNMDLIANLCNPVIVMSSGSVLVEGDMAQVRRDPRVLEAYLGTA